TRTRSAASSTSCVSEPSPLLAVPVTDATLLREETGKRRVLGTRAGQPAANGAELPGVGVLEDLRVDGRADRQVPELDGARIHELMGDLGTAGWTRDEVTFAHNVFGGAEAQQALALENEEELLVGVVVVEWKRPPSRRHGGDVVAELPGAQQRAHRRD